MKLNNVHIENMKFNATFEQIELPFSMNREKAPLYKFVYPAGNKPVYPHFPMFVGRFKSEKILNEYLTADRFKEERAAAERFKEVCSRKQPLPEVIIEKTYEVNTEWEKGLFVDFHVKNKDGLLEKGTAVYDGKEDGVYRGTFRSLPTEVTYMGFREDLLQKMVESLRLPLLVYIGE